MTSSVTNLGANVARRYMEINSSRAKNATEQLASGLITSNPSNDPSAAAVGKGLSANVASLQQAGRNVSQAIAMCKSVSGFLGASQDVLIRMKQLTVAAGSDTIGPDERGMLNKEFQALNSQIDLNANNARWGGNSLLTGGAGAATAQAAAVAAATVAGGATGAGTYFAALGTAFTPASSQGFIDGVATDAKVTMNGALYDVSVIVGNQTFKGTTTGASAGLMLLTSTTDSGNTIALTIGGTAFGAAAAVEADLKTQLGIGTGLNAVFNSVNTTASGMTGVTLTAGSGTSAGAWALSYTVSGTTGTFKLTNGIEQYTASASSTGASLTENVTFSNGVSLALAAFNGSASVAQNLYTVSEGTAITKTFQIAEKASDTLSVTFRGATKTAFGLNGLDISTKEGAAQADAKIQSAINAIGNQIAEIGGITSEFKFMADTLNINIENTQAAKSSFTDADIAGAMQELQTYNGLGQIAQSVFTKALNDQSNLVQMVQSVR